MVTPHQLTRWELANLCGTLCAEIREHLRDRHISDLARTWLRIQIPILRKLRAMTKEVQP
jgi:hypothetical protein